MTVTHVKSCLGSGEGTYIRGSVKVALGLGRALTLGVVLELELELGVMSVHKGMLCV